MSAADFDVVMVVTAQSDAALRSLERVAQHRTPTTRIIVVNNGGGPLCAKWLSSTAMQAGRMEVIERELNLGYTRAVNAGLRRCTAEHIVVVGSSVTVSAGWLEGLRSCAESSRTVGLVGPLSDSPLSGAPLSVESAELAARGVDEIVAVVRAATQRAYPKVPCLDGACILLTRATHHELGDLDEATFPLGAGAFEDYCLRAGQAGLDVLLADDVFVSVAAPATETPDERVRLEGFAAQALERKHGPAVPVGVAELAPIRAVRAAIREKLQMAELPASSSDARKLRVLWLLPSKGGSGGNHAAVQDAIWMTRLGAQTRLVGLTCDLADVRKDYRDAPALDSLLLSIKPDELLAVATEYDVVVATHHSCVAALEHIARDAPQVLPVYDNQDYEPLYFEQASLSWKRAVASYRRVPEATLLARSKWLADQVSGQHGVTVSRLRVGVDPELYFPSNGGERRVTRIVAMVRPQSPRRGAARTMRVLSRIARRFPAVEVHVFGCSQDGPAFQALTRDFPFTCHGMLTRSEMGALLRKCDIFLDLSDHHAVGRLGLEAMASGCVVVVPRTGGTVEYAEDGENALVVDSTDEDACEQRVAALLGSAGDRARLRAAGIATARALPADAAALEALQLLARAVAARRLLPLSRRSSHTTLQAEARPQPFKKEVGYRRLLRALQSDRLQRAVSQQLKAWPSAERRVAVLTRKGRKLARDPEAFFADSSLPVMRGLGALLRRV